MSNELIAQMLEQDGGDQYGYYAEYNNDANYGRIGGGHSAEASDDDEDYRVDYNYRPKSKAKRAGRSYHMQKKKNNATNLTWLSVSNALSSGNKSLIYVCTRINSEISPCAQKSQASTTTTKAIKS